MIRGGQSSCGHFWLLDGKIRVEHKQAMRTFCANRRNEPNSVHVKSRMEEADVEPIPVCTCIFGLL